MKTKISVLLSVFLLAGFCAPISFAQAQEQKPQLYWFYEIGTSPSAASQYEAALKAYWSLFAEVKSPNPWYAYSHDDFHYLFFTPVDILAAIDAMNKSYSEMAQKVGLERFQVAAKSTDEACEFWRQGLVHFRPDLSYTPTSPRLKPEEQDFFYIANCSVIPGKQDEFEGVMKEWAAFYKSRDIRDGFATYVYFMGPESPLYNVVTFGKSSADFWGTNEINNKNLGEKDVELWNKTLSLLKKLNSDTGRYRPDLSYTPEAKKPVK